MELNMELKKEFITLWGMFSKAIDEDDVKGQTKAFMELEKLLPFKSKKEHDEWLNMGFTFRCFEDFEEMTFKVMNGEQTVEQDDDQNVSYQIIFHSGSYKYIDGEVNDYDQALELRDELASQMRMCGERDFYYEIKEIRR